MMSLTLGSAVPSQIPSIYAMLPTSVGCTAQRTTGSISMGIIIPSGRGKRPSFYAETAALTDRLQSVYANRVTFNSVAGIGVPTEATKVATACIATFVSPVVCLYGRPGGRSRKARRCFPGTPTSVRSATSIGVEVTESKPFIWKHNIMATQLVPVFTGDLQNQPVQLCNARDLHKTLQVGDRFDQWIKRRIEEYGFNAEEDYCTVLCNRSDGKPGKGRTEYHITLDMAKELAMIENNFFGREVRRYFIRLENESRPQSVALPAPTDTLSPKMRSAINRKAHALSLESFDRIRACLEKRVREWMAYQPEAQVLATLDHPDRLPSTVGDMHLIHADDLWHITATAMGMRSLLEQIGDSITHLEQQTGRQWYGRPVQGK